jgi:metal-dependent hydrolase (beta-lactamase superfamily II)
MMLDLCHHDSHDEYEHIINYYKTHFKRPDGTPKSIFRYVCSHPHSDHIRGLNKLFNDAQITILNFWDLEHSFVPEDFGGHETHEQDWKTYKAKGNPETKPPITIITYREGPPRDFWHDGEDRITVLAPSQKLIHEAHYTEDEKKKSPVEIDEMSYALLIRINQTKVLFAGDGKERTWNEVFENCGKDIKDIHILKAGHHGQESGFHEDAVKIMVPKYIVISNSKEKDKDHGASDKYKKAAPETTILKTWEKGTIIAECGWKGETKFYKKDRTLLAAT